MISKYCIIGAGAAGITAAKNLKALGIPFDVVEREDDVGGNWYFGRPNSAVYQSTRALFSKPMTAYTDYPMPDDYPDYPSHAQVLVYLREYARHFGIYEHTQFGTAVEKVVGVSGNSVLQLASRRDREGKQGTLRQCEIEPNFTIQTEWDVTLSNDEIRRYKGVIIANGHHWDPNVPPFSGHFDGKILHSKQYKTPGILRGKRVLVIGAGASGCDLVVEAVHHADKVFHSTRHGHGYLPNYRFGAQYAFGKPIDQVNELAERLRVPLLLRRAGKSLLSRAKLLETRTNVNSPMRHGDVVLKPDVAELRGHSVGFIDGSVEKVDLIICATGFKISFPFIDRNYLNWQGAGPGLFLHAFHPRYDNLFVVGLLQPNSGLFWLMDLQAHLAARFIYAQQHAPTKADAFRRVKAGPQPDIRSRTIQGSLGIDHIAYKKEAVKLLAGLQ